MAEPATAPPTTKTRGLRIRAKPTFSGHPTGRLTARTRRRAAPSSRGARTCRAPAACRHTRVPRVRQGAPIPTEPAPPTAGSGGRRSRRGWFIGGGVVALLGVGAGAWAALNFFPQGAQPCRGPAVDHRRLRQHRPRSLRRAEDRRVPHAEQVPGVQGPGGHQQRRRHPAKRSESRYSRTPTAPTSPTTTTSTPGSGDRAAAAAVDLGGDEPDFVVVVQVKDEGKARDAITELNTCSDTEERRRLRRARRLGGARAVAEGRRRGRGRDDDGTPGRRRDVPEVDQGGRRRRRGQRLRLAGRRSRPRSGAGWLPGWHVRRGSRHPVPGESSGDSMVEPGATPSVSNSSFHATTADGRATRSATRCPSSRVVPRLSASPATGSSSRWPATAPRLSSRI